MYDRYDKEDLVWNVEDSRESLSSRRLGRLLIWLELR